MTEELSMFWKSKALGLFSWKNEKMWQNWGVRFTWFTLGIGWTSGVKLSIARGCCVVENLDVTLVLLYRRRMKRDRRKRMRPTILGIKIDQYTAAIRQVLCTRGLRKVCLCTLYNDPAIVHSSWWWTFVRLTRNTRPIMVCLGVCVPWKGEGCALHSISPERTARLEKVDTWLILPVVICLSQRLSHACLSINLYTVKLRMAH